MKNPDPKLPSSWISVRLDTVANVMAGNPAPQGERFFDPDGPPFVRVLDMGQLNGRIRLTETRDRLSEAGTAKLKMFKRGGVLLTKSGASTLLNQRAILGQDSYVVSHISVVEATDATTSEWVYFFLRTVDASNLAHGGNMPSLPLSHIKKIEIPLAPIYEQKRIVEKVETLFTRLDKGEEAVREVQNLLTRYRQSVLKSAVTGQLTADWRAQREGQLEHGRNLLERILQTRREQWSGRGKYKEPAEPDTSDQVELPEGWTWATIEQLGFVQSGQTPKGVGEHVVEGGAIPWFKVSSMNDQGNEEAMYTSQWMFTEDSAKAAKLNVMPEGTIVFPKRGGAILTNKKRRLGVPGALDLNTMGFVPVALANYVWTYFLGLDLRQIYDGSNVPQINYRDIADLFIAVPSELEANVISEVAEQRLRQIAKLEEWCETELKRSTSLRQSILKDAFAGRLIPQDPNDEPASALLDRIQKERELA